MLVTIVKGNTAFNLAIITNADLARGGTSGGSYNFKKSLNMSNVPLIDAQVLLTSPRWPGNLYINDFGIEYSTKRKTPTKTHDED